MASTVRNTGTRFRYDADDQKWAAKVRVVETSTDGEKFTEFITKVATWIELVVWLASVMDGIALSPGTTLLGHDDPGLTITGPEPP